MPPIIYVYLTVCFGHKFSHLAPWWPWIIEIYYSRNVYIPVLFYVYNTYMVFIFEPVRAPQIPKRCNTETHTHTHIYNLSTWQIICIQSTHRRIIAVRSQVIFCSVVCPNPTHTQTITHSVCHCEMRLHDDDDDDATLWRKPAWKLIFQCFIRKTNCDWDLLRIIFPL